MKILFFKYLYLKKTTTKKNDLFFYLNKTKNEQNKITHRNILIFSIFIKIFFFSKKNLIIIRIYIYVYVYEY